MHRSLTFYVSVIVITTVLTAVFPPLASGGDEVATRRIELQIESREVQLKSGSIRVTQGEKVELVWTSDEVAHLHLHGYDIEFEVGPQGPATYSFLAYATGRFPVTSHGFGGEKGHGHKALLYLEVYPD